MPCCSKVLHQQRGRQAAVDLDLVVAPFARPREHLAGDVGGQQGHLPAGQLGKVLAEQEGEAVRLLPGGAGGAPDVQPPLVAAGARISSGITVVAQRLERVVVAEERGLGRHHRLDDLGRAVRCPAGVRNWATSSPIELELALRTAASSRVRPGTPCPAPGRSRCAPGAACGCSRNPGRSCDRPHRAASVRTRRTISSAISDSGSTGRPARPGPRSPACPRRPRWLRPGRGPARRPRGSPRSRAGRPGPCRSGPRPAQFGP